MKTYPLLAAPVPTISYCIIHQSRTALFNDEHTRSTKALHDRVQKESAEMRAAYARGTLDAMAREAQTVAKLLSQFLETPIQSDKAEVERILADGLERFAQQVKVSHDVGVAWSSSGRVCFPSGKKAMDRKMHLNAKAHLQELGFSTDSNAGDILESVFTVEGGMNLDLIEFLVRDKMGIYAEPHGVHVNESGAYTFAAYNQIYASGTRPPDLQGKGLVELVIMFSKPAVEYARFRESIVSALEGGPEKESALYTTLWQRKLGLGKGKEFILRFICDDQRKVDGIVHWLHNNPGPGFPAESVVEKGAMLYKEPAW